MANNTITKRQREEKMLLIEQLKKLPIIGIACEKVGLNRSTYYRWMKEDKRFAAAAREARREGVLLVNDMAESLLLSQMKSGNLTAMIFWLKHNNPTYETRIAVRPEGPTEDVELSPEEAQKLAEVLSHFALPAVTDHHESK